MSAPSPALVAALEAVGTLAEAEGYRSASWGRHGDLQLSWAAKVDDGRCYGWRRCPITGRPTCNVELIHSVEGVRVEVTAGPSAALISRRLRHREVPFGAHPDDAGVAAERHREVPFGAHPDDAGVAAERHEAS